LDANLSGKSLNVSVVRSITGQDFMNVSQISTKASASISCGSNNLPDARQTSDCKQVAVFRRLAVIPMSADATSLCVTRVPADKVDNVDFAISCVYVRSRRSRLTASLLGSRYYGCVIKFAESLSRFVLR